MFYIMMILSLRFIRGARVITVFYVNAHHTLPFEMTLQPVTRTLQTVTPNMQPLTRFSRHSSHSAYSHRFAEAPLLLCHNITPVNITVCHQFPRCGTLD